MGLLNRLFGFRWSLYICKNGEALYAMHENGVIRIVGYVMDYFKNGASPRPPWSLHLNFNKSHIAFELKPEHFTESESGLSSKLISEITAIDPGFMVKGGEPVFVEIATNRVLQIRKKIDYSNLQKLIDNGEAPTDLTFFGIMDTVFEDGR